jgi:selenide,water dikinase
MSSPRPPAQQLLLAGGGHTHALLLLRWLMRGQRPPGAITLVNRASTALYSGMLPGLVAGVYALEECSIDLRRLCAAVDVTLVIAEISGLELAGRQLLLAGRPPLVWDWLSLDLGATTSNLDGCRIGVKPLEPFLHWLQQRPAEAQPLRIRGGGAAAVELALALRGRQPDQALELLLRGDQLHLQPTAARPLGERLLRQAGVAVRRRVAADRPAELACTGSRAPAWLAEAGLPCDGDGRIRTTACLQVEGQPRIFAVGDCGVLGAAPRPPSGVWAVRAAPTLAANLARCLAAGEPPRRLRAWRPQRRALQLLADLSRGEAPAAIALWGPLALGPSPLLWRWKQHIDRRFMARFQQAGAMDGRQTLGRGEPMACRGCAAKLAPGTLEAGLRQAGLGGKAEDAAVLGQLEGGELLLQSVDGFPALVDDPWLNARLTTLHACSDLWASGARMVSAQAVVTLPEAAAAIQQQALAHTLAGIRSVLDPLGAELVGGHTLEARDGAGLALSLSVNGSVAPARHWPKGPLRAGQSLILTRPLGTGVLFAAAMAGDARAAWIDAALEQMQQSQAPLVPLLQELGCSACTDITGFGLLGHLGEMLAASPAQLTVRLDGGAVAALPGALDLLERGRASSLAPANARALALLAGPVVLQGPASAALHGLLIDPQTCGPLLAAIPATAAETALEQLARHGFREARLLGEVTAPGQTSEAPGQT